MSDNKLNSQVDNVPPCESAGSKQNPSGATVSAVPAPIFRSYMFLIVVGAIFVLVFLLLYVMDRTSPGLVYLSGAVIGCGILIKGLIFRGRWRAGKITEHLYRCVSCRKSYPFSIMSVTRRRDAAIYTLICTEPDLCEDQRLYEFVLGRGGEQIPPGQLVVLYLDENTPKHPVAWKIF